MHVTRAIFGTALIVVLTNAVSWAQATAQLNGTVRDESGAVLPGVTVTVTQTDTQFMRTALDAGTFGQILTQTGDPRIMQFGFKFGFQ